MCFIKNDNINDLTKRIIDVFSSLIFLIVLSPLFVVIAVLIKLDSKGSVLFWACRFGRNKKLFSMPKFRTMIIGTPITDSDSFINPDLYITNLGKFLRKTSIDEMPQLYCVLLGQMSLVGPRPALFNELDIVKLRDDKLINFLKPGISGYAQINGHYNITNEEKVNLDYMYSKNINLCFDIKILFTTIFRLKWLKDISH